MDNLAELLKYYQVCEVRLIHIFICKCFIVYENLVGNFTDEISVNTFHLPKVTMHTNNAFKSFVHSFVNLVLCVHLWPLPCPLL
jgi:hypothetical protein